MFLEPDWVGAKKTRSIGGQAITEAEAEKTAFQGEAVRRAPCDLTESGALSFCRYVFPRGYVEKAKMGSVAVKRGKE